ncbi:hypothetical protein N0V92_004596 [Colletotrichum tropicale]|nr:hypothetical protein N0V92_004596 [Colletotrichum tropicale]
MLVFTEVVTIRVKTSITGDLPISLDLKGSPATAFELVPQQATGDDTVARFECEVIASKNLVVFMKWPAALFSLNVILRAAGPESPNDGDSQPAVAIISKKDLASAHRIIDQTLAKTGYEAQSASFVQWWCSASMTHGEIVNSIDDAATRMVSSAKSRAALLVILLKIDPTLRESKTELFRSVVEEKVMQSSLSDETARAVIRSYIKGADDIGNLRIESFHWEMPPASPDDTPERRLLREKSPRSTLIASAARASLYAGQGATWFPSRSRAGFSCSCPSWPSESRRPWINPASSAATITTTTEKQRTTLTVGRSNAKIFLNIKMGLAELVDDVWSSPNESQATLTAGDGTSPVPDFD